VPRPVDTTGAQFRRFKAWRKGVLTINGTAALAPLSTAADGHWIYNWGVNDVVLANVGWHECKWELTDAAGKVSSYPTNSQDPLRLHISAY
jgi:hypothetical protein